jgi:hypothetical protein
VSFDERAALEITAVRALETAARSPELWADADRAWASRAAAEVVGEGAAPEAFLAVRARLALERVGERIAAFPRAVRALRWRSWVGIVIVAAAFLGGAALDEVGGSQRINLLAPPFFLLLVWNIAVYALLVIGYIVRYGEASAAGPLRSIIARLAGGRPRSGRREIASVIAEFAERWSRLSARLYTVRAARLLHLAAAALAGGLVTGLYVRGLAFEYRATWESTFLGAETVHSLLAAALAPGAAISGIHVPGLAEIEAIRAPASENAARWLHLIAATVALVVVAPRLALALSAWLMERYRQSHMALVLDEPYFARLLRGFRGGPLRVRVVPYSYAPPQVESAGLERVLRRVFGGNASLTIQGAVAYGDEDALAIEAQPPIPGNVIALFSAAATPEREAHGAFLDALRRQVVPGGTLVALVDESALQERWGEDPGRLKQRRESWSALCAPRHVPCVFARLRGSDLADATSRLERAIEELGR